MTTAARPRIVWSIAGTDSAGGAGLAADLRMAQAFGVHLCPVVAAVTAQNSVRVDAVQPVGVALLDAQLAALELDMPPVVVKTGLLGDAAQIEHVARWIDRLREHSDVALVVDPVLGSTTGASFADEHALDAMRELLLPRATLVTPNRREAHRLLRQVDGAGVPELAALLRALGPAGTCVTGGDDAHEAQALDWMDTPQARGWLSGPRIDTAHLHGTGCSFATAAACGLALGFVAADALVLAKMASAHAIAHGWSAGAGAGPVMARDGFASAPERLPMMSWAGLPSFSRAPLSEPRRRPLGLYAIVDSAQRVRQVLEAGVRTVQLRIKRPAAPDAAWHRHVHDEIAASATSCDAAGAELFVNDHWQLAMELGVRGVHLGQEDLLALTEAQRQQLRDARVDLGISSHSLWELCRAASMSPRYIACGPVWPTLTKAMPWKPQGLHNLAWWRTMSPAPVVAIGGILSVEQAEAAARCGADGVCIVRAIGDDAQSTVPDYQEALRRGHAAREQIAAPSLPLPTL